MTAFETASLIRSDRDAGVAPTARGPRPAAERPAGDLKMAVLTGAVGWRDRDSTYSRVELTTAALQLTFAAAAVTVLLVSATRPGAAGIEGATRWVLATLGSVTLLVSVSPSLAWPLGWRPRRRRPVRLFALVRVATLMLIAGCWTALLGPMSFAPAWILGGVVGTEYLLTAWALGLEPGGWTWWRSLQLSPLHVGAWLLVGAVALRAPDRTIDLLRVPLTFQAIVVGGAFTVTGLSRLQRAFAARAERERQHIAAEAHKRTATWLHNEVTSQLHLLRFRVESGRAGREELQTELDKLEHTLRLRQMDELFASGQARLADVVQAYVRVAQSHGIGSIEVPRLRAWSIPLDPKEGDLVRQALGVLVPNALAAGAQRLVFRAENPAPGILTLEIEDDAGGFDFGATPEGRGLHTLCELLGPGRLACTPTADGSRLRAVIDVAAARLGPAGEPSSGGRHPDVVAHWENEGR